MAALTGSLVFECGLEALLVEHLTACVKRFGDTVGKQYEHVALVELEC